jgi:uncharacterized protein (DUF433 family)
VTGITIITADALRAKIDSGLTTAQIAASFGVQSPAVTRACHRYKLPLPASGRVTAKRIAKEPARADDDRLLDWLAKARRGWTVAEIAETYGYASGKSVQMAIKAVEVADLTESGEPVREVTKGYLRRWAR